MEYKNTYTIHKSKNTKNISTTRGALLIEALVALSLLAGLLLVGSQSILAGLSGAKSATEKDVAVGMLQETLDAVRAGTDEDWQNLYGLLRSPVHYYPLQSAGKWVLFIGDETLSANGLSYTRFFTVDSVSRDTINRAIEATYDPLRDDPSTQKVTVTVVWRGGNVVAQAEYLTRWRNKVCVQTAWNTPGSTGVKTCPDSSYSSASDVTGGTSLKLTPLPL